MTEFLNACQDELHRSTCSGITLRFRRINDLHLTINIRSSFKSLDRIKIYMERLSYLPINNHSPSMYEIYKRKCGKAVGGSLRYGGMVDIVYGVRTLLSMIPDYFSSPKRWKSEKDNSLIAYLIEKPTTCTHKHRYICIFLLHVLGSRLP